jgi:hypothetical protein
MSTIPDAREASSKGLGAIALLGGVSVVGGVTLFGPAVVSVTPSLIHFDAVVAENHHHHHNHVHPPLDEAEPQRENPPPEKPDVPLASPAKAPALEPNVIVPPLHAAPLPAPVAPRHPMQWRSRSKRVFRDHGHGYIQQTDGRHQVYICPDCRKVLMRD